MRRALKDRTITFTVEDGCLVRTVTGSDRTYQHRCSLEVYEAVAHALEETPVDGEGVTCVALAEQEQVPFTQADLAVAFLLDRGIVDRRHRRNYPVGTSVHLDAMIEWHALAEQGRQHLNPITKGT
jgi:hypothetical protein